MKLITPGVVDLIGKYAADGTMTAGNAYGAAGLAPFHDFEDKIPQEVKDKLAEIDAGLNDGSITTGYQPVIGVSLSDVAGREAGYCVCLPFFQPSSGPHYPFY